MTEDIRRTVENVEPGKRGQSPLTPTAARVRPQLLAACKDNTRSTALVSHPLGSATARNPQTRKGTNETGVFDTSISNQ